eukprot:TRINITY_DN821_c0_g1_i1.p1 TRINITY_DN821_c0_g1~~TRINITY_DN821_c0_g1_i1.p1  ORF type:complete len:390 (-),score=62.10 TRINITY_DN821_c0_g1_i1:106-1275(-)
MGNLVYKGNRMRSTFITILIALVVGGMAIQLPSNSKLLTQGLTFRWEARGDVVRMAIEADFKNWVGIGFGSSMTNTDMIVIEINDNDTVTVTDRWSKGRSPPSKDEDIGGRNDVVLIDQEIKENSMKVVFERKQITGDKYDTDLIGNDVEIVWAYSPSKVMKYHRASYGVTDVQLSPKPKKQSETRINSTGPLILPKSFTNLGDKINIHWELKNDTIVIGLETKFVSWVGIGFGDTMNNTDMILVEIKDDNSVSVTDRWALFRSLPTRDEELGGTNDVRLLGSEIYNNTLKVLFERKLITGDKYDAEINVNGQEICWAYSDTKRASYHKGNYGLRVISFSGGPVDYRKYLAKITSRVVPYSGSRFDPYAKSKNPKNPFDSIRNQTRVRF